jgi:hypothetical protein
VEGPWWQGGRIWARMPRKEEYNSFAGLTPAVSSKRPLIPAECAWVQMSVDPGRSTTRISGRRRRLARHRKVPVIGHALFRSLMGDTLREVRSEITHGTFKVDRLDEEDGQVSATREGRQEGIGGRMRPPQIRCHAFPVCPASNSGPQNEIFPVSSSEFAHLAGQTVPTGQNSNPLVRTGVDRSSAP